MSTQLLAVSSFPDFVPPSLVACPQQHHTSSFFHRRRKQTPDSSREPSPAASPIGLQEPSALPTFDTAAMKVPGSPPVKPRQLKKPTERHGRKRSMPTLTIKTSGAADRLLEEPPAPPAKDLIIVQRMTPPQPIRPLPELPSTSYTTRGGLITPVTDPGSASPSSAGATEGPLTLKASVRALVQTSPSGAPITPSYEEPQSSFAKSPRSTGTHRPSAPRPFPPRSSSIHPYLNEANPAGPSPPLARPPQWRVTKSPVSDTAGSLRPALAHSHTESKATAPRASSASRDARTLRKRPSRTDERPFTTYADQTNGAIEAKRKDREEDKRRTGPYHITVNRSGHEIQYDAENMIQVIAKLRDL